MHLNFQEKPDAAMQQCASDFYQHVKSRRTVRDFSEKAIPQGVLDDCILAAGTAPNGANLQPWHFAVVTSQETKSKIRSAAEEEEKEFYGGRAPQEWLDTLSHLKTDEHKPFLEKAPALIAIFQKNKTVDEFGKERKCYYPKESVGIATGILITALHNAGLASLTHTPSPMGFLNDILDRPSSEKPYLLLVVGFPAENCEVPDISKLPIEKIRSVH